MTNGKFSRPPKKQVTSVLNAISLLREKPASLAALKTRSKFIVVRVTARLKTMLLKFSRRVWLKADLEVAPVLLAGKSMDPARSPLMATLISAWLGPASVMFLGRALALKTMAQALVPGTLIC